MKSLFNYDSPFMQTLMTIADLVILNVLFLLCCLPIFTIGAAQSGLFNAVRVLLDKEDDSSCAAAFFRGFKNGFGRITMIWIGFLLVFAVLFYNFVAVFIFGEAGLDAPTVFSIIGLCLCALLYTQMTIFHSRFSCTIPQLFKNAVLMTLAHPLRGILIAVLTWLHVIITLTDLYSIVLLAPVYVALWFSVMAMFSFTFMKKPFKGLEEDFLKKQATAGEAESAEQIPEDEAEETYLPEATSEENFAE